MLYPRRGEPIDVRRAVSDSASRCVAVVQSGPALKVFALGIEEQRVRTTIDFVDPSRVWSSLGHDYRVNVHVAIWSAAVTVPIGALIRENDSWAVFAVVGGRARSTPVKIGRRTGDAVNRDPSRDAIAVTANSV